MKIAFFDSGIGGLSVLQLAIKKLPNASYIYFADTDNVPYGIKSKEQIRELVFSAVDFLSQFELKALVLACNTATSVVVDELRESFNFPIIGMEPAVKPAALNSNKKILVCATQRTLKEEKLDELISNLNAQNRVVKCNLQELVTYAENFDFYNPKLKKYLENSFESVNWKEFDTMVLGCTHFLYFKPLLKEMIPSNVEIVDGNEGTINRLMSQLETIEDCPKASIEFFVSKKNVPEIYFDNFLRYLDEIT